MNARLSFFLLAISALIAASATSVYRIPQRGITYDQHNFLIDGKPTLLLAGTIHYPRSTPEQWPLIFKRTKEAGLNTVETYVFWNVHEEERGVFDFDGHKNLRKFIQLAAEHDLYVVLRFGPYVCAEWNYGGFPAWLREIPDISFRTNNQAFMLEMTRFLKFFVDYTRDLFWENGGPVILLQVENEYGLVEKMYGQPGHEYIEWAVGLTQGMNTTLPWFVCVQDNVKDIVNACNGFYCDEWVAHSRPYQNQPAMFTEDWTGWFTGWGDIQPQRPSEDLAFALARFIARGGVYHSHYPWHGGTNFGRTAGWNITTTYDYDAPLDEYGMAAEPKYTHLSQLHHILMQFEAEVVQGGKWVPLGNELEAHVFGDFQSDRSLALISNWASHGEEKDVVFEGTVFKLPKWSVSLVQGPASNPKVLYNTARVQGPQRTRQSYVSLSGVRIKQRKMIKEPIGIWNEDRARLQTRPMEQVFMTRDKTDYLWYIRRGIPAAPSFSLWIEEFGDIAYVYWNGHYVAGARGGYNLTMTIPEMFVNKQGANELQILSQTIGLTNFGAFGERFSRGLNGMILLNGVDISEDGWLHQVGLQGEHRRYFDPSSLHAQDFVETQSNIGEAFTWHRFMSDLPRDWKQAHEGYALDLGSMGRGNVWVNGFHLGRYWNITTHLPSAPTNPYPKPEFQAEALIVKLGDGKRCDYAGGFNQDKCRNDPPGLPSQRYYHVPKEWLKQRDNVVVLFEELGGHLDSVRFVGVGRDIAVEPEEDVRPLFVHQG